MVSARIPVEFREAEVENEKYSIANLFYYLKARFVRISFRYSGFLYRGSVEEVNENEVRLVIIDFQETQDRRAVLQFEAFNRFYHTPAQILRTNEQGVFIQLPEEVRYLARRKHARISFDDMFMRFIILYSPIKEDKEEEKNMEGKYPYFMGEVLQDQPSARIIYQMFISEINLLSREFSFRMFYHLEEKDLTIYEWLLKRTGRTVYIEDVSSADSYISPLDSSTVTNLSGIYKQMVKDLGQKEADDKINEYMLEDSRNFLVSYMLVPVNLFGYPVGYVRLETNQFDKYLLAISQAEELHTVAELFSYGITKIRIRNSHFDPSSIQTRVVNISQSGLLIELTDQTLYYYLQRNRRIKMLIPIAGEELEIYGEIVRYYHEDDFYYMGIIIFKSMPGDMHRLENYIHENLHYHFF